MGGVPAASMDIVHTDQEKTKTKLIGITHKKRFELPKIIRIDHIAIAASDLNKTLEFWQETLGLELKHLQDIPQENARIAFLPVGDSDVELVMPNSPDTGLARFLSKRGPGIHHICFEVDDLEGLLARLKSKGVKLINEEPVAGLSGIKYAFIHPESAHGVLVELYQKT